MPRFPRNTRLWCLAILMFSVFTVNALTLNPLIEAPDGHTIIDQEPLLFNDQIIFVTEKDDSHSLWAYDLSSYNYIDLHTFEQKIIGKFYTIGNHFFFKERYEPSQIWQSDGTVSGTKPVSGLFVGRTNLHQQDNILFNKGNGFSTQLMIFFDGSTIKYYESPSYPLDQSVCTFNVNDVVIPSLQTPSSNRIDLIRYKNNSQTDYTSTLTQSVETFFNYTWFYDDTCFIYLYGQDLRDIMVIPEQGDHYFLGEQLGLSEVNYLTRFKNHYYLMGDDENGDDQIFKISLDLNTIINQAEFDTFGIDLLKPSVDYLIAYTHTGGNASPPAWKTVYFDEELNEIPELGGPFTYVPKIKAKNDGEVVVYTDYSGQIELKTLTLDITDTSSGLVLNGNALSDIITNENSSQTFVLLQDLESNQSSIKKLDATPDIGSLSVGNWFDPDYQSQGVSIVEGERDDGSRYLFVTLYLFQDGQPLWLAGTSNISFPQPALDIELGAYSGPGLWQADTPATVEKFADMTLSMSSCHRMMLAMETEDGQFFNLELQRMVNKNIDPLCQD